MEIRRGALVLAAGPGDKTDQPRPFLVVQSDAFNGAHASITLCPVSGTPGGENLFRVTLEPGDDTGLHRTSEVQVDKVQSLRRERLVRTIGTIPVTAMTQVDDALRRWLAL